MTRYAKTMSEALAQVREGAKKITKQERDKLEDDNQHGELALRLAQSFGTPQEVKKIKDINKRHMQKGSIDPKDQKERDAISNKYYKMAEGYEIGTKEYTDHTKKITPGEVDEAKYQVNYSKNNKLYSKTINAKDEDDAEEKAIKKFKIDDDDIRSVVKEEVELDENYRKLAMKGIGTETKKGARVGLKTDYYLPSNGDKSFGKITRVTSTGYEITDEKTKKVHKFNFYDPKNDSTSVRGTREEVELDEKYDLYHKSFSDAMQHAYDYAKKKMGITVDPKEIDSKVATGPKKPSEGKTNTYRLKGKGGNLQIQVYNKGGSKPFELNMYKEETELDEGKMKQVQSYIDDIVNAMKKDKLMKPFADKFKKDALKTLDPEKSLEKILPDYIAGKDIAKLLNMGEGVNEMFDYVLLDKENKIVGRYSGKDAKKNAEMGKKSAHLPPMRIPKGEVSKMKVYPISPKDKKGIGDMVLAIGEEVKLDEAKSQGMFIVLEKGSKNKVIGQFKDKRKAIDMMKKNAGSKVIQIGKYATVDDKPVDIKVGDELSYTRVKLSTKIKEGVEQNEGMWSMASTPKEVSALKKLMQRPIPVGDPEKEIYTKEMDALYGLLGDDELFDDIGVLQDKKGAKADARPVILKWFAKRIKDNYGGYGERTRELAKAIGLKKIAAQYESTDESVVKGIKEFIKADGTRRRVKEGDKRRKENANTPKIVEDSDEDKPGTQGDADEYQKKRKAVAKKFGVTSCSQLSGDKKKACYTALDKAHVADHEEQLELEKMMKEENGIQRYFETKKDSLRDAILNMWKPQTEKNEKDEEKGLTKKEKNDTMTDTGKKITPVEISPKMAKIKNEKNRV